MRLNRKAYWISLKIQYKSREQMFKKICDYCYKPINNRYYKHVVIDDTLKIGTTFFIDIITKNYHYKCYRKMLKENKGIK